MKQLTLIFAAACVLALTACNTVEGAGRDIQKVGEKVEDAAAKKK